MSTWLDWLDRAESIARSAMVGVAACAAGVMMLHITADVFSRYFLNAPFESTIQVVSAYYMVIISLAPLAYVAHHGGHIFVELFTQKLPPLAVNLLDAVMGLIVFAYLFMLTWQTGIEAVQRSVEGEVWEIASGYMAVWPSRWLVPIGCGVMGVHVLLRSVRQFAEAFRR